MSSEFKNFGLYGREFSTVSREFIHLVSIDSSCRKHDWVIKPHFHSRLYQFFVIESGSGTFIFGEKARNFAGRTLIVVPENSVHGFQFSDDIQGYTLSVSSDVIDRLREQDHELLFGINKLRLVNLNDNHDEFGFLMATINSLARELSRCEEKVALFVETLVQLFLIKIFRLHREVAREYVGSSRELAYYKEFMRTVKQGVPTNRSIDDFTKVIGISKTHLNRVCQTVTGESTKQVIGRYLANEAMILLAHSELTISEIAHQLDFKDVSYFCRFFKKQAGIPPARFRDENLNPDKSEHSVALNY